MDGTEYMEELQLKELLEELINDGHIANAASIGIAKIIIYEGFGRLSSTQQDVYNKYILPIFDNETTKCKICQSTVSELPTSDKYTLITTGYCPRCEYNLSKED